jgi:uncharacterized protein (DUF362 family)
MTEKVPTIQGIDRDYEAMPKSKEIKLNDKFMLDPRKVAIAECNGGAAYPAMPPYRPDSQYPEFSGRIPVVSEPNPVYPLCRQLFADLGLDADNSYKYQWNPLAGLVNPGDKVLVKPNLVRHIHLTDGDYEAVVTHGSVIRCLLDYVALALKGRGEIIVGDAPVQSADFGKIIERTGLQRICEDVSTIWGIPVRIVDFRLWAVKLDGDHRIVDGKQLDGDPSGYRAVDLGRRSLLAPIAGHSERFRVTCYDSSEMGIHHNQEVNEYLIPQTVLDADVVINLPKLKTHRKVGLTASLKNLVGINGQKDWLPHHRCGSLAEGGDEFPQKSQLKDLKMSLDSKIVSSAGMRKLFRKLAIKGVIQLSKISGVNPYEEGSWYGNDTLWRTVLDLNRILLYADREGRMMESPQRRCFTVVDGIIAGEGEGPMEPDARHCGVLVAGVNPVAVDAVLATMVGFDYRKIPLIANGFISEEWQLTGFYPDEILISSSSKYWQELQVGKPCSKFRFDPPSGWRGHVELSSQ